MGRAARSRIMVEVEGDPGLWSELRDEAMPQEGFNSVPEAESWVRAHIEMGDVMRVVKISGVFRKTVDVIKR